MLLPLLPQADFKALDRKLGLIHSFRCSALLRHNIVRFRECCTTAIQLYSHVENYNHMCSSRGTFASLQLVQLLLQLDAILVTHTISPPYMNMFALEQVCAADESAQIDLVPRYPRQGRISMLCRTDNCLTSQTLRRLICPQERRHLERRSARHADWSVAVHSFAVQAVRNKTHAQGQVQLQVQLQLQVLHRPSQSTAPHIPSRRLTSQSC